ncbi:ABC transporter substrate-binding protein [Cytobacillus depressus]|uniref:ABC transporter substrate-binding protein n=1 Tax=Cytobacillus depressus TaxID=1602942 RepID=A0A6L3VHF4_9BACI|nr:ABC transporter substrate-binding protein [Cytobacillus depressus]KAB2338575.1 ABC transporter substrate-binding protein [Cytobacillus depressus]
MKKVSLFFVVLVLAFSIIGCSAADETSTNEEAEGGEKVTGGELQVAYNAQPPTLDPLLTTAVATRDITRHIFESLVTYNQNFEVEPMLAESLDVSEDGKTITFDLRKGIKFHNGNEMSVGDVVASMNRWKDTTPLGKSYFANATFTASGDNTVVLEMPERLSTALAMLADPGQAAIITPKEVNDGATEEKGLTEFIGTGPYKFVEWKADQYIHLEKFEDYQSLDTESSGLAGKKEAFLNDIYFQFVTDASTRLAGIQTGEYDVANAIPFDNADQLEANKDVVNHVDHNGFNGIVFNKKARFFKDVTARQAVNAALNQEEILMASFTNENFYELEHGLMIKDQVEWYSEAGKDQYNQHDQEKAKELLKDAGYNGEDIIILTSKDYTDHYNAAVVVQQQLEKIGMKVKLDVYDWPTVLQKRTEETAYDIFVTGFPTEPIPAKYVFLDSANEWPGWTNSPEIDGLLDKISGATSQEEAKKYFAQLQEEFYNYLPMIKFGNKTTITTTRSNIKDMGFLQGIILWNIEKE